jgi:pimeloyl-ACP methyl ester carboxylesterase
MNPPTSNGTSLSSVLAVHFGDARQPLFGWWHPAPAASSQVAVICSPFGIEELSAYRSLRHLAGELAASGVPTLRFDYAGCGDSSGDNEDGDRVPHWIASVMAAADLARSMSGASEVIFVGVRLGALLAAAAAVQRDDVQALVAIAPPSNGQNYVRECRIRLLGAAARSHSGRTDGGTQAGGFVLNGPTCESLSALAPTKGSGIPASRLLLIERDDLRPGPWAQHFSQVGAVVRHEPADGVSGMLDSAYKSVVPRVLLNSVVGWVAQLPKNSPGSDRPASAPSRPWADIVTDNGVTVREQAVRIDAVESLSAFVTEPLPAGEGDAPRRALLILNTAGERRTGPSRVWVPFARERAAGGQIVMRLDQAGVGDSDFPRERSVVNPYSNDVLADIAAALEWLRDQRGVTACTVLGLCSGSYHGLKAALAGLAGLDTVVAVNPSLFYWHDGMPLEESTANPGNQVAHMHNAVRGIRDPQKWVRLLKGDIDMRGLGRVVCARAHRGLKFRLRDLARMSGLRVRNDLAAELRAIAKKGIGMQFVFSAGDPGLQVMKEEVGGAWRQLVASRAIGLSEVADADHSFMSPSSRRRLYQQLNLLLDRAVAEGVAAPAGAMARPLDARSRIDDHSEDLKLT